MYGSASDIAGVRGGSWGNLQPRRIPKPNNEAGIFLVIEDGACGLYLGAFPGAEFLSRIWGTDYWGTVAGEAQC